MSHTLQNSDLLYALKTLWKYSINHMETVYTLYKIDAICSPINNLKILLKKLHENII